MKYIKQEFIVNASLEDTWEFFLDVHHFEKISPKNIGEKLVKTTNQKLIKGTHVWIQTSLIVKTVWHSVVTYSQPYMFIDELQGGHFKIWKHKHAFEKINQKQTKIIDEINFEMHYGVIGKLIEKVIFKKTREFFEYRKQATMKCLDSYR